MIICLVSSPTAFAETRALLHNWFLLTGLASILEVKAAIVSAVLDVLSKPMWWGLSMELGLKFPFSYAYFLNVDHDLLSILTGPISGERFLDLVHRIVMASSSAEKHINQSKSSCFSEHEVFDYTTVAYNSTWAMLMDFPAWFYYATALIFCLKGSLDSVLSKGMHAEAVGSKELHEAAVLFISWVLCPLNQVHFDLLVNLLNAISRLWTSNYRPNSGYEQWPCSDTQNKTSHGKRLRVSKISSYEKPHTTQTHGSSLRIGLWLTEFQSHCAQFFSVLSEGKSRQSSCPQPNLLLRKVPLGILISCPNDLDEKGSELVLHFASTGEILNLESWQKKSDCNRSHDNHSLFSGGIYGKWAMDGACLVFDLMGIVEDISVFLFDCEETRFDFVGHVKGNSSSYLLHCVKVLLDLQFELFQIDDIGGEDKLLDLYRRLMHWKDQHKKPFGECREFNDFLDNFAKRFSFFGYQDKVS